MITAAEIHRRLRAAGTQARAVHAEGYTPSAMKFLGVATPEIRKLARSAARERKSEPAAVIALAQQLVDGGTFDGRQVAYVLFERNRLALEVLSSGS